MLVVSPRKREIADDWDAKRARAALPAHEAQHAPGPGFLHVADGRSLARAMTQLQARAGNRALQRALAPSPIVVSREDDTTRTAISETTDTANKYTQDMVLNKTQKSISINLGVKWVKKGTWASDDAMRIFINRVKAAVYSYMDKKFKVVCTPSSPAAGPATIELPITFLVYDFDTGYPIDVHGGQPGTQGTLMSETGGQIYEYQSATKLEDTITFAHEFGHALLGVSDEYANPRRPDRVLSNDHSIMGNYYAQGMDQAEFKARHFKHIGTEIAKAFAGYTCTIQPM